MANQVYEDLSPRFLKGELPHNRRPDGGFTLNAISGEGQPQTSYMIDTLFFTHNGIEVRGDVGVLSGGRFIRDGAKFGLILTTAIESVVTGRVCEVSLSRFGSKHKHKVFQTDGTSSVADIKKFAHGVDLEYRDANENFASYNIAPLVNTLHFHLTSVIKRMGV